MLKNNIFFSLMYIKFLFSFVFVLFLIGSGLVCAQSTDTKESVHIIGKSKDGKVVLRWAPNSASLWQLGNQHGYKLERRTITANGQMVQNNFQPKIFKVYPKEAIEVLSKQDERVMVVNELVYQNPYIPAKEGDAPSMIIEKKRELDMYFASYLLTADFCPLCAQVSGLSWTDSTAKMGEEYAYQISLATEIPNNEYKPSVCIVKVAPNTPLVATHQLKADFRDKKVLLRWNIELDRGVYTAYWIERSEDGKKFERVNKSPFVYQSEEPNPTEIFYLDSIPQNYKFYYYRLRGITPFAEDSEPSKVVKGKGKENLNGLLTIDSIRTINNKKIQLYWHMDLNAKKKIKGFEVRRSAGSDKPFLPLTKKALPPSTSTFVDEPNQYSNYYEVVALSEDGEELARSFPYFALLEDNVPPAIPQQLIGKIDDKGVVMLAWMPNQEADLRGYRVFRANSANEEFIERTRNFLDKNYFVDTVNIETLTKYIHYKVIAVDINYNPSEYSLPLTLRRPDKIAPSAPVFTYIGVQHDSLKLQWTLSSSDDVSMYVLSRQKKGEADWKPIKMWKVNTVPQEWQESSPALMYGEYYKYKLIVEDSSKNVSQVVSPLQAFETGTRPEAVIKRSIVNREQRSITIEWSYEADVVKRCIVYRRVNQEPLYWTCLVDFCS
jgi:hypothetical protein